MTRARLATALFGLLLVALIAGCGSVTTVREPSLEVPGGPRSTSSQAPRPVDSPGEVRIAVVTHGQSSSQFWAIVRNGVDAGMRQMNVTVDYQAPDIYSIDRMRELIDRAIASRPDGLVLSFPEPALAPDVRRAVAAGIPTVTINSGSAQTPALGVLAHIGQPEEDAGLKAGRRLAAAGVRRAMCVIQQVANTGLQDRCRGLRRAMREVGGSSTVLAVDDQSTATPGRIAAALRREDSDGVLALNSLSGGQSVQAVRAARRVGRVTIGVFDLGPDIIAAVRSGAVAFAVDQQPYLQGYLPIVLLTQLARYGLFPEQHEVIATGPNFVTKDNAAKALTLSRRSIR
jgi:simple sugar transport system substrate-binding protein